MLPRSSSECWLPKMSNRLVDLSIEGDWKMTVRPAMRPIVMVGSALALFGTYLGYGGRNLGSNENPEDRQARRHVASSFALGVEREPELLFARASNRPVREELYYERRSKERSQRKTPTVVGTPGRIHRLFPNATIEPPAAEPEKYVEYIRIEFLEDCGVRFEACFEGPCKRVERGIARCKKLSARGPDNGHCGCGYVMEDSDDDLWSFPITMFECKDCGPNGVFLALGMKDDDGTDDRDKISFGDLEGPAPKPVCTFVEKPMRLKYSVGRESVESMFQKALPPRARGRGLST